MMPQGPMQQPGAGPQPVYQPQYVEHKPVDYLRPLASDFVLALGTIVGLFLMMLGSLIWGLSSSQSVVWDLGKILAAFGTFIISAILLMGAIVRVDADKLVRVGYLIAAVAIIIYVGFW